MFSLGRLFLVASAVLVANRETEPRLISDVFFVLLQDLEGAPSRRMDRLRRSLRSSLRRKKDHRQHYADTTSSAAAAAAPAQKSVKKSANSAPSGDSSKPVEWQNDEVAVRSGTCSFKVKVRTKSLKSQEFEICDRLAFAVCWTENKTA